MSGASLRLGRMLVTSLIFYDLKQAFAHARIRNWLRTRVLSFEMCELIEPEGSPT